eukprot:3925384-Rhodomonas_salina.1
MSVTVTDPVFQPKMSSLKEVALLNMPSMVVTVTFDGPGPHRDRSASALTVTVTVTPAPRQPEHCVRVSLTRRLHWQPLRVGPGA